MINALYLPNDQDAWTLLLQEVATYDFYHTAAYHIQQEHGTGILLSFRSESGVILLPIIMRPIDGDHNKDITSVYGYAGPLASEGINEADISLFQQELVSWMSQHHIISLFARLHPFIDQKPIIEGIGEIREVNKTRYFDLSRPLSELWSGVSPAYRRDIRSFDRLGATIEQATTEEQWQDFATLYYRAMDRLEAQDFYYFDSDYFNNLRTDPSYVWRLLMAYSSDRKLMAGVIISTCRSISQYHLGAVSPAYQPQYSPLKSLLWRAATDAKQAGAALLHIGGGVGGSDCDGLFVFKSRLASSEALFSTWCWVIDTERYQRLSLHSPQCDYFPQYRAR